MKRKWMVILLMTVLAPGIFACGTETNPPANPGETTEKAPDENALTVRALSPFEETDVVHLATRTFLTEAAKRYDLGDTLYRFTAKKDSEDTLGSLATEVTFEWEIQNGEEVQSVVVQYSEGADFADYREASPKRADASQVSVNNIKTGATYYWRLKMTLNGGETVFSETFRFETIVGPRVLSVGGVKNIRDLGGWTTADGTLVPEGRVFRSGTLDHPDEEGKAYLLEELGIKTEIDMRNDEKDSRKPIFTEELNYVHVPDTPGYGNFLDYPEVQAEILRVFTKPENYPVIFHCAEGADRTGVEAVFLNALLGVPEGQLVCDYEISAGRFRDGSHNPAHKFNFPGFMQNFLQLEGANLQEKARHFYLNTCGVSEMELANYVALRMNDHAVYADPPKEAIVAENGKIAAEIVLRGATSVSSVTDANGAALPFSFKDGILTITVSGAGSATIAFDDGGTLPVQWCEAAE